MKNDYIMEPKDMTIYQLLQEAESLLVEVTANFYYEPIYAKRKAEQLRQIVAELPDAVTKFAYNTIRER